MTYPPPLKKTLSQPFNKYLSTFQNFKNMWARRHHAKISQLKASS